MAEKIRDRRPIHGYVLLTQTGVKQVYMVVYEDSAGTLRNRYEFADLVSERTLWERVTAEEKAGKGPGSASLRYWAWRAIDPVREQVWKVAKDSLDWFISSKKED